MSEPRTLAEASQELKKQFGLIFKALGIVWLMDKLEAWLKRLGVKT